MGTKTLKYSLTLACIMAVLVGCTSGGTKTTNDTPVDTGTTNAVDNEPVTPQETQEQEPVVLDTVFYFDFDQSILKAEARAALTAHAERIKANPVPVRLEGHTDERGSREYNMALGERRANAVRDFLTLRGVDASLIETVSYGEEYPAAVGSYEEAWSQNRRVEMK